MVGSSVLSLKRHWHNAIMLGLDPISYDRCGLLNNIFVSLLAIGSFSGINFLV